MKPILIMSGAALTLTLSACAVKQKPPLFFLRF